MKKLTEILAEELKIKEPQAAAAVRLLDEGNTVPFLARYRKEATGGLNDEVLRALSERLSYLRNLEERKETVLSAIKEQGKLTGELRDAILSAETLSAVEDLYLPYRPKKRTRATIAKERGLEPLADLIFAQRQGISIEKEAERFLSKENGVATVRDAIAGARDILAERIAEDATVREHVRSVIYAQGLITSTAKKGADPVYEMYADFSEPVKRIAGHRVLALNRGEAEKALTVKIEAQEEELLSWAVRRIVTGKAQEAGAILSAAIEDGYKRLLLPQIEREIRSALTERAEDGAIRVFGKNLTQLLMQPPVMGQVVLGWDPAFRTGCKLAVVDETGRVLDTTVIYPTAPQNKVKESKALLKRLIAQHNVTLISLGNGTASRESEQIIAEFLREEKLPVQYVIVNEAGASVYSASKEGSEEFPQFDVGQRSAVSMARRLQDPLAELVKIDPKSIGVGQYQHDCDQKKLTEALSGVVETCVNRVGVDLNTASAMLLSYVSGITKTVAKNIVAYREAHGAFTDRKDLLSVEKLGPKAFTQCAGFLRITGGRVPLDQTAVHPESYPAARKLLEMAGFTEQDLSPKGLPDIEKRIPDIKRTAEELKIGEPTLCDILSELKRPSRDPREDLPRPVLRSDVLSLSDLKEGMVLKGTVRNVIDFGAFVDIGVHQDGLVHISELADRFVKHPLDVVSVGDVVTVRVLSVDTARKRIALSMKGITA